MKDKKILWGTMGKDASNHIYLIQKWGTENIDLTQLLDAWYSGCFVKIEIETQEDKRLEDAETNTINDI